MAKGRIFSGLESKQAAMRERQDGDESDDRGILRDWVESGKIKRPKNRCPICYGVHMGEIPMICWTVYKQSNLGTRLEFEKYATQNKLAKFS